MGRKGIDGFITLGMVTWLNLVVPRTTLACLELLLGSYKRRKEKVSSLERHRSRRDGYIVHAPAAGTVVVAFAAGGTLFGDHCFSPRREENG